MPYIELFRRFQDLPKEELPSPEVLAYWSDHDSVSLGWNELLEHPRVILLAEAGSGKTEEMQAQAERLRAEGKPAFFIPLESLDKDPLRELLSPAEEQALAAWKADEQAKAYFLLDAVDELKLVEGKLKRALGRLAKEIDGLLHRAHIIISCRPFDWQHSTDMMTVQTKLPFVPPKTVFCSDPEEAFLASLREPQSRPANKESKTSIDGAPKVVVLLPLNERQISTLASSVGVSDTARFMEEIQRRNAWTFARRPSDLIDLAAFWEANGRLGTRREQHVANVATKLKENPDRPRSGVLSEERARSGAERLALALALTHTRTIRAPEHAHAAEYSEGVLDPAEVLPDWTPEERRSLLSRALFDPATYGRIRFHHRTVQEYLAAERLRVLSEKGMSITNLRRLLFGERYGLSLVIPSMQAIAAWLALTVDDVRRELMRREPETLLSEGDPESLPIEIREQLLRSFAAAYGEGGWRGLNIPLDQVRRLAHPDLAPVVREIWSAKPLSPDVSEVLLDIIRVVPIQECWDIAYKASFATDMPDELRVFAIRVLVSCGRIEAAQEVARSIGGEPEKWPDRVIHAAAEELFPGALPVTDLITLIRRVREPKNLAGGFSWATRQIVEKVEPASAVAYELRNALADLIWQGRSKQADWHSLHSPFDHIAPALARLCDRQLEVPTASDSRLIWASVVANRFGDDERGSGEPVQNLRKRFEHEVELREAGFWSDLSLIQEASERTDAQLLLIRAQHRSLIGSLTAHDRSWLLKSLREAPSHEHRMVALHGLMSLWHHGGRAEEDLEEIRLCLQGDEELALVFQKRSAPPEPDPQIEEWNRRSRQRQLAHKEHEEQERQRVEGWKQWHQELLANPGEAFDPEHVSVTIYNIYEWLSSLRMEGTRYSLWDAEAVRASFGEGVAKRIEKAFTEHWRMHPPIVRSQQPEEDRNSIRWVWAQGLTGLAAEAMAPGWANRLTSDEACIAAAYATIEINGFPNWLGELATRHPDTVEQVIGGELEAELAVDKRALHPPTLQSLSQAAVDLKRLVAPCLKATLPGWVAAANSPEGGTGQRPEYHLGRVLSVLHDVTEGDERAELAHVCERQFTSNPRGPVALTWLRGLFRFDPERGTSALESSLRSNPEQERSGWAIAAFAELFGDHGIALAFPEEAKQAATVDRLIRSAYLHVRPDEDRVHEGVYSADLRDQAERARQNLLGVLLDTPGPEAQKLLGHLTADPLFSHYPDRLRLLARRRAAAEAENPPLTSNEVFALERRFEAPPSGRDGLFTVMLDRLDDLAHNLAHDDFTDRSVLRTIKDEIGMQRTLAARLKGSAKGSYIVSREEEVADRKEPDIRLATTRGGQKAAIEVKIADSWTLGELENALRHQLVGQYLRHDNCRSGCLLLTYSGRKSYWGHPQKGRLSFAEVIEHLRELAQEIERESNFAVLVAVFGLDLRDP